jgi:inorganic pyrophosphatase
MWFLIVLIVLAAAVGAGWAWLNLAQIKEVPLGSNHSLEDELHNINFKSALGIVEIGAIIHEGATEFIVSEYRSCAIFIVAIASIVWACVDGFVGAYTNVAFLVGAGTSMACGAFGMHIATLSNFRTTICARNSLGSAFRVAYRAGVVIGFALVAASLLTLLVLIETYRHLLALADASHSPKYFEFLFEAVAGFGLGGSTVALFARVGGGIFTKAADLGSDLVGKIESGLPEDSPRNPATIADNVGDNVGDIAGMGADLFGSFAESTCAALIIGCNSISIGKDSYDLGSILYVLVVPAAGILVSLAVSRLITEGEEITQAKEVERELKKQLVYSTLLLLPALWVASYIFLPAFKIEINGAKHEKTYNHPFFCLALGLVGGLIIGYATEIMTSYTYNPVQ